MVSIHTNAACENPKKILGQRRSGAVTEGIQRSNRLGQVSITQGPQSIMQLACQQPAVNSRCRLECQGRQDSMLLKSMRVSCTVVQRNSRRQDKIMDSPHVPHTRHVNSTQESTVNNTQGRTEFCLLSKERNQKKAVRIGHRPEIAGMPTLIAKLSTFSSHVTPVPKATIPRTHCTTVTPFRYTLLHERSSIRCAGGSCATQVNELELFLLAVGRQQSSALAPQLTMTSRT